MACANLLNLSRPRPIHANHCAASNHAFRRYNHAHHRDSRGDCQARSPVAPCRGTHARLPAANAHSVAPCRSTHARLPAAAHTLASSDCANRALSPVQRSRRARPHRTGSGHRTDAPTIPARAEQVEPRRSVSWGVVAAVLGVPVLLGYRGGHSKLHSVCCWAIKA